MNKPTKILKIKDLVLLKNKPEEYYKKYPSEKPKIILAPKKDIPFLKSYSHMPYIANMPYDRNSRHPLKMCARYIALDEYEQDLKSQVSEFNKEFSNALDNYNKTKEYVDILQKDYEETESEIESLQKDYDKLERGLQDSHEAYDDMKESLDWSLAEEKSSEYGEEAYELLFGNEGTGLFEEWVNDMKANGYDMNGEDPDSWLSNMEMAFDESLNFLEGENKTGFCDEEHAQMIDDYITDLKQFTPESKAEQERIDQAIEYLEKIKDNSGYEEPFLVDKDDRHFPTFEELNDGSLTRLNQIGEKIKTAKESLDPISDDLQIAKEELKVSKKQMSNSKRKAHERNVALYEVANEKQNCSDVFDNAKLWGDEDTPTPNIKEYSDLIWLKTHLNRDGTVQQDYLTEWERDLMDSGYWESRES